MKPGRRVGLALAAVLPLVGACQLLIGVGGDDFVIDDAGSSSADTGDAPVGDGAQPRVACATGVQPVGPPASATGGPDGERYVFALRTIDVSGRTEAGAPTGFDLDRVCSCDGTGATSTCTVPATAIVAGGCDDDGGVDNSMFHIWDKVGSTYYELLNKTIGKDLRCGHPTLLLLLSQYNGLADDPEVLVHPIESYGILDDHDGGEVDGSPCGAASEYRPAKWDGTDPWSVPSGAIAFGQPTIAGRKGYVRNFQLVVDSRDEAAGPLVLRAISASPMMVDRVVITAKLVPTTDGSAKLALTDGLLAGRVRSSGFLSALAPTVVATANGDQPFCAQSYWGSFHDQLCAAVDTLDDPTRELHGDPCNAISFVIGFTAAQSIFGSGLPAPTAPVLTCDGSLTCPTGK